MDGDQFTQDKVRGSEVCTAAASVYSRLNGRKGQGSLSQKEGGAGKNEELPVGGTLGNHSVRLGRSHPWLLSFQLPCLQNTVLCSNQKRKQHIHQTNSCRIAFSATKVTVCKYAGNAAKCTCPSNFEGRIVEYFLVLMTFN